MTQRDILFLLAPGFVGRDRREYCPECAEMWGLISYFPAIKEALEIRYETIEQPRVGLVALLGDGRWNCPTLILARDSDPGPDTKTGQSGEWRYIDNARDIGKYFAHRFGTPMPRGS